MNRVTVFYDKITSHICRSHLQLQAEDVCIFQSHMYNQLGMPESSGTLSMTIKFEHVGTLAEFIKKKEKSNESASFEFRTLYVFTIFIEGSISIL